MITEIIPEVVRKNNNYKLYRKLFKRILDKKPNSFKEKIADELFTQEEWNDLLRSFGIFVT